MGRFTLKAAPRTIKGRKTKQLRKTGVIPANVYGKKITSVAIQVEVKEFERIFSLAGETSLVELVFNNKTHPVLIHNVSYHPVTDFPLHIDFLQVDLKEKVTTRVSLHIKGESPAVKDKIGTLLTILSEIEIEALPTDLPDKIEVDISSLTKVGDVIKVGQLVVDKKIKIISLTDAELVKIAPLISKEAEAMAKEAEAAAATAAETTPAETPTMTVTPQAEAPAPKSK